MKLTASTLLLAASIAGSAYAQTPYSPEERIHWIDGKEVTITYSPSGAPSGVTAALMTEVLADIEAKFDGLNLPGLNVSIGNREVTTGCENIAADTVRICWEPRTDQTAVSQNNGRANGANFHREAYMVLPSNKTYTEASLYAEVMHHMMHVLGFAHPVGDSVLNGAADLTQLDINGLQTMYAAGACALTYDAATRTVNIPFVKYRGGTYTARLQHEGGNNFAIVPGSVGMLNSMNMPTSRCQALAIDGNNELHIPQVRVGNGLFWANLKMENGRLTLTGRGQ